MFKLMTLCIICLLGCGDFILGHVRDGVSPNEGELVMKVELIQHSPY